jgi:tRNA-specific 2-thiouridylase
MERKLKVAVGLSGGVDSAVSAYLLKEQGYEVVGVNLICWDEGPHCKAREDRQDALKVALHLGIPFEVLDFQKEYKERVIDRFYKDYAKGLTPNPDVWCNSEIKFGLFLDWAKREGFDYLATGHYAKKVEENEEVKLMIPEDERKDQTYFIYQLKQEELKRVMFPLENLQKSEVRKIAKKVGLPVADKKDSVGICFVGDIDVQKFLRRRLEEKPGEVVDIKGEVIGIHKGMWFYTIGQRGGWEVKPEYQKRFGGEAPVMYVVDKIAAKNRLVVGFGAETYKERFMVKDLSWTHKDIDLEEVKVRIRHGGKLIPVKVVREKKALRLELLEPERWVAAGQIAVFYKGKECLGGGVI